MASPLCGGRVSGDQARINVSLSRAYGRGGARREAVGGEGLYSGLSKTLTSQASGLGPLPRKAGEAEAR
jgi:hypothetical protein